MTVDGPVRIVHVAHSYPRWDGDPAGAFIERLLLALRRLSHDVAVVVPADEGAGGKIVRHGIPVVRMRYAPRRLETLAYRGHMQEAARSPAGMTAFVSLTVLQAWGLVAESRQNPVDVIHAHWWIPGGISAGLAHLLVHRPYVLTLHGTDVATLERSAPLRTVARRVLRGAAALTAVSSYLADRAAAVAGLDPANVLVQPMPLDIERYRAVGAGGGGIVTVGRLVRQKNIHLVLEAVAALRDSGDQRDLTVVGDGPERGALERLADRLGIANRTRFVGTVDPARVPDFLRDADVMVFPAVGEGLGLAVAEAFMVGVPVVAAEGGGGVRDIMPTRGAGGRFVPADDPNALAEAISNVCRDPAAREDARRHGLTLSERFDPLAAARTFESVYERALARRSAWHA